MIKGNDAKLSVQSPETGEWEEVGGLQSVKVYGYNLFNPDKLVVNDERDEITTADVMRETGRGIMVSSNPNHHVRNGIWGADDNLDGEGIHFTRGVDFASGPDQSIKVIVGPRKKSDELIGIPAEFLDAIKRAEAEAESPAPRNRAERRKAAKEQWKRK